MKSKKVIPAVLVSILIQFFFNGCSDNPNQPINPQSKNVSGKVLNLVNQGTPDIYLSVNGQNAVSSTEGSFSFSL